MKGQQLDHARKVLQKRAELAKHQDAQKKLRVKVAAARIELRQLRAK